MQVMSNYRETSSWEPRLTIESHNEHYDHHATDTCDEEDLIISRPPAALTARPTRYKGRPPAELTPPPSPQREQAPNAISQVSRGFSGLLTRTLSINGKRAPPETSSTDYRSRQPHAETSSSPRSLHARSHERRASTFQGIAANFLSMSARKLNFQATISEEDSEDAFHNLDIANELIPRTMTDRATAASFDTLFANAEKLILRMQVAYRMKCDELHKVNAAHGVEQEELEEARMRASHLKLQLDGMSTKAFEQDEAMKSLVEEFVTERYRQDYDEHSRRSSLHMTTSPSRSEQGYSLRPFDGSRRSQYAESDSGDESSVESVFSRPGKSPSSIASLTTTNTQSDGSNELWSVGVPRTFAGLREENLALRARVAELEETVECCLGLFDRVEV